jgi:hypothetical protein
MADQAKALIFTVEIDAKTGQLQLKQFGDTTESTFRKTSEAATKAAKDTGSATQAMSEGVEDFSFSLRNLAVQGLGPIAAVVGSLTAAAFATDRLLRAGEKVSNLSAAFETLTGRVGSTSSEMLESLRPATRGLVSDLDLMQQTNAAVILGLPVTAEKMGELAEISTKLGRAMGQDAKTSLESLIIGIGRQSRLWLDNIGIIVDADKAYRDFAKTIGKTADELTDAEKKLAFFNETLRQGKVSSKGLEESGWTLGKAWHAAGVEIENTIDKLQRAAADLPRYSPIADVSVDDIKRRHDDRIRASLGGTNDLEDSPAVWNQAMADIALRDLGAFTDEIERQVGLRSEQLGLIKKDDDLAAKRYDKEHGITAELERQAAIRRNGAMQVGTQVSTGISDVRSAMQFRQGGGAMGAFEGMVSRWDADFAKSAQDAQDVADAYRNVGGEYSAAAKQLFEYRDAVVSTDEVSRFLAEAQKTLGFEFETFTDQNREAIDALLARAESLERFVEVTEMLAGAFGQLGGSMLAAAVSGDKTSGMFRGVMKSLASSAYAQSLYELALGIAALTPWGAAIYGPAPIHFKSAGVFAAVGSAAGLAARSAGSGEAASPSGGASYASAPDRATPSSSGRPIQIQINIEHALGDFDELARRIGEEVEHAARKSGQA